MDIQIGQILSQIVAFLVMLWVMKRFAWKPLLGVMEERRIKIQDEFDFIEKQKNQVDQLIDEYHKKLETFEVQGKEIIQKAIASGKELAKGIKDEADENAESMIQKAQEEIRTEISKAKVKLKEELVSMVIMASSKMIKENLDNEKQKALVKTFIDEAELK